MVRNTSVRVPAASVAANSASGSVTTQDSAFTTQPWTAAGIIESGHYRVERVEFARGGETLVGNLFLPASDGPGPAVVVLGPVAFVKEQSPMQYATRLAREGFVVLIFDPAHHGESSGEPRRLESGAIKTADLRAALAYLGTRAEVEVDALHILGLCQGVNWAIDAANFEPNVKSLALVAGHYLTPETATLYTGDTLAARVERSAVADAAFRADGTVTYIPLVAADADRPEPLALLQAPPIQQFYIRWADRGPFWRFHGLWENRIPAMNEAAIWGHRSDLAVPELKLPVLILHADQAASGPTVPKAIFAAIGSSEKELIWLGERNQMQFYEDPLTIDLVTGHLTKFFNRPGS